MALAHRLPPRLPAQAYALIDLNRPLDGVEVMLGLLPATPRNLLPEGLSDPNQDAGVPVVALGVDLNGLIPPYTPKVSIDLQLVLDDLLASEHVDLFLVLDPLLVGVEEDEEPVRALQSLIGELHGVTDKPDRAYHVHEEHEEREAIDAYAVRRVTVDGLVGSVGTASVLPKLEVLPHLLQVFWQHRCARALLKPVRIIPL
mmetsp:Transcript_2005/g.4092  ORF Transcript_2005/g.4092 Transcript_2005/m.4092 type:complete len:201 (-) Transcript_2005:71-673(-)